MKKLILALPVVAALGGCATVPGTTPAIDLPTIISQVQADARLICQFEPTAATVASLINAGIGAIAGPIASAICSSIPAAPATTKGYRLARDRTLGHVGNVAIQGHYLP